MWCVIVSGDRWLLLVCLVISFGTRITWSQVSNGSSTTETPPEDGDDGKIIGGERIDIDRIPCLVSVQRTDFGNVFYHICGGALVHPKYVIFAQHCMVRTTSPNELRVRAGSSRQTTGGQTKAVKQFYNHPDFNKTTYENDITILELVGRLWVAPTPTNFFGHVIAGLTWFLVPRSPKTVALSKVTDIPNGAKFYTAGWGTTIASVGLAVDTLFGLTVPYIDYASCNEMYPRGRIINDIMICGGYVEGGKDTCQGDSGGPLIYNDELIGLVSWGEGCALAGKPGVYTRITAYTDFINKYVKFD